MENNFLAINKEYFKSGLKSIDLLIIAQVEEFQRNKCECFITNKQFSEMFGESESTIKRSLDKLEEMGIIKRKTITNGNGSNKSRVRTLSICKARFKMNLGSKEQGSNIEEARFKNEISKVHNEPIKEKEKDNIKDNIISKETSNEEEGKTLLTEEEQELLDMNMTTLEEILEERKQREETRKREQEDNSSLINTFYEEEKERLGEEVTFIETEDGIKSYLGERCMGHFVIDEI